MVSRTSARQEKRKGFVYRFLKGYEIHQLESGYRLPVTDSLISVTGYRFLKGRLYNIFMV